MPRQGAYAGLPTCRIADGRNSGGVRAITLLATAMTIDRILLIMVVCAASVIAAAYVLSCRTGGVASSSEASISKSIPTPNPVVQPAPAESAPIVRHRVRVI